MKKYFLSILFFIPLLFIEAQELPDFTPASPTAFELTKYGDVPVNESSGRISQSIPIYNYVAGKLSLPISMSYTGNGVKVDQLPTWTGINWSLIAGGVITRLINDEPDESASSRKNYNREQLSQIQSNSNADFVSQMNTINTGSIDTKTDIFKYSFAGYSGSFYLKITPPGIGQSIYDPYSYEAVQMLKQEELKIEFLNWSTAAIQYNQSIIITTPDGIKYSFGSNLASEQTRINPETTSINNTAYYLYQIEHPFGDIIYLDYDTTPVERNIILSQSQSLSRVYDNGQWEGSADTTGPGDCPTNPSGGLSYNEVSYIIYNARRLRKIRSNRSNKEVVFSSAAITTNENYNRILDKIEVIDALFPETNKKIAFKYLYPNGRLNSSRFFLEEIDFINNVSLLKERYKFEYNDPLGLPIRFSSSQDYLGYYNGKDNNTNLLPRNQHKDYFTGNYYADREPDFNYASKGALTRILYPTKGYTEIEYESPQKISSKRYFLEAYSSQGNLIPNELLVDEANLVYLDPSGINSAQGIYKDQTISVDITARVDQAINNTLYKIKVGLYNLSTNQLVEEKSTWIDLNFSADNTIFTKSFEFDLKEGKRYKIRLSYDPASAVTSELYPAVPVMINAHFDVVTGHDFVDWLGLRVKRLKNYTSPLATPITKRYYYNEARNFSSVINKSVEVYEPEFISYSESVSCCSETYPNINPLIVNSRTAKTISLSSNSYTHFFPSTDSQSLYKNVTISYGGDNFENGGVEKKFFIASHKSMLTYPYTDNRLITEHLIKSLENSQNFKGMINGKILKESTFLNGTPNTPFANDLRLMAEKTYNYESEVYASTPNLSVIKLYDVCTSFDFPNINNLFIATYSTFAFKSMLVSEKNTTYIDPVPIADIANADSYKKTTTTTKYEYNSFIGQPTKIITATSRDNKTIETKNFYVNQVNELSGLTLAQISAYETLKNTHRLKDVIQTEVSEIMDFTPPKLLSRQRTLFKPWNKLEVLVLPEIIQTAKGINPFENRIKFHGYNNYGDLLEVSKQNGSLTRYMYNAESLVIRKIENYIPSMSLPTFEISNDNVNFCTYQNQNPNSLITFYNYKSGTRLISSIIDSRCNSIHYDYLGNTNRLKYVKDKDGNILSKNEYNYSTINPF